MATESQRGAADADGTTQSERFLSIGQRLRQAREAQGMERATVAAQLHLPVHLLDDLEAGRMERLAPIYRRGYINSYASVLGLDQNELAAGLRDDPPPALTEVLPVRRPRFRFDKYMKLASYLIATIAIVPPLVIVYLNTGAGLFEADRSAADVDRPALLPLAGDESSVADATASVPQNEQRPVTASAMPLTSIRPVRSAEAPEASASTGAVGVEDAPLAAPEAEPSQITLTLRLLADSWVEISAGDDERLEYDLLRADQERIYQAQPPLNILLGRANAVDLIVNGERLRFDGDDRGDVAQLRITEDGLIRR
jgi:cytoskeleton protein RodZ